MIKVGITGNMGSGKTTVCKLFELLGVPVYYADEHAKKLLQEDDVIRKEVQELLGDDVYDADGNLKRKLVAEMVFSDPQLLKKYNAIIHPAVLRDAEEWLVRHQSYAYTIKEAALLFESGSYKTLDRIICVTAPEELRIQRVIQRDETDPEEVRRRMKNQWPEKEKADRSDFVIYNDGEHMLIPQVLFIHDQLLNSIRN